MCIKFWAVVRGEVDDRVDAELVISWCFFPKPVYASLTFKKTKTNRLGPCLNTVTVANGGFLH